MKLHDGLTNKSLGRDHPFPITGVTNRINDSFETLNPDLWDLQLGAGDFIEGGGNTAGSGYTKISKSLDQSTETILTSKFVVKSPFRVGFGMSLSQRLMHQRFTLEFVGVDANGKEVETVPVPVPVAISSLSQTTTTLTVTTATPHGLLPGERVFVYGASDSRFNYGECLIATIVSPTQLTITATIAATIPSLTASVSNTGFIVRSEPFEGADNVLGIIWEGTSASNAKMSSRTQKSTLWNSADTSFGTNHTNATVANTGAFADAFNPAYIMDVRFRAESVIARTFATDSTAAYGGQIKRTQVIPDITWGYKLRIRAKNHPSMSKVAARISNAAKSASTTATITTVEPHGLTTGDQIMIYGIRDQTNFANLTTATAVASVVNDTTFTVAFGASATATSKGGVVVKINGSYPMAPSAQVIQSMSASGGLITVTGNTTWAGFSIGDTVDLRGIIDASTGTHYTQYEGAYKVANMSTSTLTLYAPNVADFAALTNVGGAVFKRTDYRLHLLRVVDYTRQNMEIDGGVGNYADTQEAIPVYAQGSVSATITTGQAAHDAAVSGNPLRIAGRGMSANYTTVASGDVTDLVTTLVGALINKPYSIPELDWLYACAAPIAVTADQVVKAAPSAGIRNYVTNMQIFNTGAVATEVVLKDGATVIWRSFVPANMPGPVDVTFYTPLRGTAATAVNFACITAGASVYLNVQGYQAP